MAYLQTGDIYVFPSVQRNTVESRSFTEENVANLIYNFVFHENGSYYDGFVITDTYSDDGEFEFNIRGYYFKVSLGNIITDNFSSDSKIYAGIKIGHTNGTDYNELEGTDSGGYFEGVEFDSEFPMSATHALLILEKVDGEWQIPKSSKVRFDQSTVGLDEIDGGTW